MLRALGEKGDPVAQGGPENALLAGRGEPVRGGVSAAPAGENLSHNASLSGAGCGNLPRCPASLSGMRRALALLFLAALIVPAAIAQATASQRECFELYNAGRPMDLLVESLGNGARKIGLSEESLQAAAESRLRAARLYTEDRKKAGDAYLYVNVNVVGRAFNVSLRYNKRVPTRSDNPSAQ